MSNYTKSTNFASKDSLPSGSASKIVKGTEINTEFDNIATAVATKLDSSGGAVTSGTIDSTTIGATTPSTGAFTTLSASSTVSGTGFSTYLASPPAIGGTAQAAGSFTTVTASTSVTTPIITSAASTALTLKSAGTTAVTIDTSQNVGVGVTPSAWSTVAPAFQIGGAFLAAQGVLAYSAQGTNAYYNGTNWIYRTSATASLYQQSAGVHSWQYAASGTAGNAITFTQAMTLDASGNLLVGTTSGTKHMFKKDNNNNEATQFDNSNTSNPYVSLFFMSGASPNNTTNYFWTCVDGSVTTRATLRSNGGLANYSGNNVNLSDRREKINFAPAGSYLEKICAIPVQTFNYIDQNLKDDDGLTLGVVAQDVQAVAPELVMESNWAGKDEEPKIRLSIYQTDLQYALMKCIQEQQALIDTLTAKVAALEAK